MELGLLYYNARFYAPGLGRFISADTIIPNPANPQSYNRYAYVLNRTLNFTDPTGHRECDLATGDCSGGGGAPSLPPGKYYYNPDYGYFDRSHFGTGNPEKVIADVRAAIADGGGSVTIRQGVRRGITGYEATYSVSGNVTEDQTIGVALGIYMDWSIRFEEWEGNFPRVIAGPRTSFSIEDLPSQYVGFFAAANNMTVPEVLAMLGGVESVDSVPHPNVYSASVAYRVAPNPLPMAVSIIQTTPLSSERLRNTQFTPMVHTSEGWQNVSWPNELQITPISNSGGLWEFQDEHTFYFNGD
jgi:RHS repeat-associated protein